MQDYRKPRMTMPSAGEDAKFVIGRTYFDALVEQTWRRPDAIAVIDRDRMVTYATLLARAEQVAALLYQSGIRRHDRVGLLLDNRIEWLEMCFAASAVGASLVPFSTFATSSELSFLIADSRIRLLFIDEQLAPVLADWKTRNFPDLTDVVTIGNDPIAADLAPLDRLPPGERASATDDALILYTSGSSSYPKAVRLPHYALLENGYNIGDRQGLGPDDRVLLSPPLFWAYGSGNALPAALTHGAVLVLQRRFNADEALDLIERHGVTAIYTLPGMTAALLRSPAFDPAKTITLRTGLTIGSPQDIRAAVALGATDICNVYGASETCGNCCVTDHRMKLERRAACQGRPLPGVELRIVDPATGAVLPANTDGAVEVRGYLTSGYSGRSAKNNADVFTPDGFFRMGDIGRLTEAGEFVFAARADEMIKRAGINVSPAEVEEILLLHPAVAQAGVVGVPDPDRGEAIVAFVVPIVGVSVEPDEIVAHCKALSSRYKVPDRLNICAALPTTATGKVRRLELRAIALESVA